MEVKADKKLLTVLFPDGRDGRAFTLKVLPPSLKKELFSLLDWCRTTSKIGKILSNNVNCDVSFFQVIIINASQILFAFHMYKIQNTVPL